MEKWIRVKVTNSQYDALVARAKGEMRTLAGLVWQGLVDAGYITKETPAGKALSQVQSTKPDRSAMEEILEWDAMDGQEKMEQLEWAQKENKTWGKDGRPWDPKTGEYVLRNAAGKWVAVGMNPKWKGDGLAQI